MEKTRRIFMGVIPFFEDYAIYWKLQRLCRREHTTLNYYIIETVREYMVKTTGDPSIAINTPEKYHIAVSEQAAREGLTIAALMEKICAEKTGEAYRPTIIVQQAVQEKKKDPWYVLPSYESDKKKKEGEK